MIDKNKNPAYKALTQLDDLSAKGIIGFEREGLRVLNSKISQHPHPKSIGSALCNQYITTDFSESQLEIITPPLADKKLGLSFLEDIQHFIFCNIGNEILWPFSIPPNFESEKEIPIANYGSSNLGKFKHIYRKGLSHRYGKAMQAISGFHYNYSLPDKVWEILAHEKDKTQRQKIRSEGYFHLLRNTFRINWLILYLFGASPVLAKNLLQTENRHSFEKLDKDTFYLPYATSLRMSDYGYQNSSRVNLNISPNSLDEYIFGLSSATKQQSKDFLEIFENNSDHPQLNANVLQIEDEYYAVARPKSKIISSHSQTSKLKEGGVDFIELRSLDLNPFSRTGIDLEAILFLEVFLIYCFIKESPPISKREQETIIFNDLLTAKQGRKPNLSLLKAGNNIYLKEWGNQILDEMVMVAELLDQSNKTYFNAVSSMKSKINDPHETLSAKLIDNMLSKKLSFNDLGNSIGEDNRLYYLDLNLSENENWDLLLKESNDSLNQQQKLELEKETSFSKFLSNYIDTKGEMN